MTQDASRTIRAGVMGWPVSHSLSPRLHGYWLDAYGIQGSYEAIAAAPGEFAGRLRALAQAGYAGVNVTIPHKERALAEVDEADDNARRVGAVNTIVMDPGGRLLGSNTDGFGFLENLAAGAGGWSANGGPAVVLGAGGAARSVVAALVDAGAPEVRLVNRTRSRAEAVAADIGGPVGLVPWEGRAGALGGAGLLVNTTSLGMVGNPPLDLALDDLPREAVVTDVVYVPLQTPLLAAAAGRGNVTVDGLGMLLHQARPGFAAWFGVEPDVTPALRAHVIDGMAA